MTVILVKLDEEKSFEISPVFLGFLLPFPHIFSQAEPTRWSLAEISFKTIFGSMLFCTHLLAGHIGQNLSKIEIEIPYFWKCQIIVMKSDTKY